MYVSFDSSKNSNINMQTCSNNDPSSLYFFSPTHRYHIPTMPTVSSILEPKKWLSTITESIITAASALVFCFLDFLEVIMCLFLRVVDEFFEGKSPSCYCMERGVEDNKVGCLDENELSGSLHGRKNVFREMGLLKISKSWSKESAFRVGERTNRWSDCGCESCVSWMRNGSDSKLHVVIKETQTDRLGRITGEEVENVIFIHGFLSSSSIWTETMFPNLSDLSSQNYKLFAVDLLGFGRSPKPRDCFYTLKDHLEMIEKSVIVPHELKSFHLVAHSMGCVIALALAAKYSNTVKSVTLVAPPYISSAEGDASSVALRTLATRRIWPLLLFGTAFMSWYEHLGRCICFIVCRSHRTWESILKLLTGGRDLHFLVTDLARHTHHSAWHSMHNVICGGAKLVDKYLETLKTARVRTRVIQGTEDEVVPLQCSYKMKMKDPDIELDIIPNADHSSVIMDRQKELVRDLEKIWESTSKTARNIDVR